MPDAAARARIRAILDFWFLPENAPDHAAYRREWFEADAAFDEQIRRQFLADVDTAAAGGAAGWLSEARSALALALLFDQFPRSLYRGTPRAFATDGKARDVASEAIRCGFDHALLPVQRMFFYLPLEHSEDAADQEQSLALFLALPEAPWRAEVIEYARRHRDVVARFGRFPHRNIVLGRPSTLEELAFLEQPGSSF